MAKIQRLNPAIKSDDDSDPQDALLLTEALLPPIAPLPQSDDELDLPEYHPSDAHSINADANTDSLKISDTLRARIRVLEKAGTRAQFRHRLSLIGAAELDESRVHKQKSGAIPLLEAVYAHGAPHWLDPVKAIMPLREIMFKMKAPPVADRGVFYVLTRVARAGISPAAFTTHIVLPRMGNDFEYRAWKSRHIWILDAIADILIDLRGQAPWNADQLGETAILSDIALCKYVGRPLARLVGERFSGQEEHLNAWRDAWRTFTFKSPTFLSFMRRIVLPCLYRLSGRIDPEQLAPIARALAGLERSLGRRLNAMSPASAERFMQSAGLADTFEERIQKRLSDGLASLTIAKELRAYIELAAELSTLDAGLAVLGRVASISMQTDSGFMADAVTLAKIVVRTEGVAVIRWHLDALARLPAAQRSGFIQETRASNGINPGCMYLRNVDMGLAPPDSRTLGIKLGLTPEMVEGIALRNGGTVGINEVRSLYFKENIDAAGLYQQIASDISRGMDRKWTKEQLTRFDRKGPAFHEMAIRSLIPGIGTGYSSQTLKATCFEELADKYIEASKGNTVELFTSINLPAEKPGGGDVEPAGRDAARARVAVDFLEAALKALTQKDGDAECGFSFSELGKEAAVIRRKLEIETARALQEEADARAKAEKSGMDANAVPLPRDDKVVRALTERLAIFDSLFDSMKEVPPDKRDPRRFVAIVHACSYFAKQGDEACLAVVTGAATRYSDNETVGRIVKRLRADAAPGFLGVEQCALLADAMDAILAAMAQDGPLLASLGTEERNFAFLVKKTGKLRSSKLTFDSLDTAFRKVAGYSKITGETAKWRDLLSKLDHAKMIKRKFTIYGSRSSVDAYYGDMGGICLSAHPELVNRPGVIVGRLWDEQEQRIRGMCLFVYSQKGAASAGIGKFWYAFAFNPLRSLMRGMGTRELLALYMGYRTLAETLARKTKMPILLAGPGTYGLISNDGAFATLIKNYETAAGAKPVHDADGFNIYYPPSAFAESLLIIDPAVPETFHAEKQLKTMELD